MFQTLFNFAGMEQFGACLKDPELLAHARRSRSVLIQFFASALDPAVSEPLHAEICRCFPGAIVTGITTSGEIYEGQFVFHRTVVVFSFFETSELHLLSEPCRKGEEAEVGRRLGLAIAERVGSSSVKGLLLYATSQRMDGAELLGGMRGSLGSVPVFGAGAASYDNNGASWVMAGGKTYWDGAAVVAFSGDELEIKVRDYMGWEPLSRKMTVTEIGDPKWIKTLDGVPAAEVYEKYLGIRNDENFFQHMLEFPLILQRGDKLVARVPVSRGQNDSLHVAADVRVGEQVRLGYGTPHHIMIAPEDIRNDLGGFEPQGIMLFSCYCRQVYLQEAVNLETKAFQQFAPAAGMYTYGEFYGQGEEVQMHNASLVAVAMREGRQTESSAALPESSDRPTGTKQMEMTSRLAKFVGVVVGELEQANREMQQLMQTDRLTGLHNRGKMEDLLSGAMQRAESGEEAFALILLDLDRFKDINDTHGHLSGDAVLRRTAQLLQGHAGGTVAAGRWGGEEFLILIRAADAQQAGRLAEQIRAELEQTDFQEAGTVTASFGVTASAAGEPVRQLFKRVDDALYAAKRGGRNRVVVAE